VRQGGVSYEELGMKTVDSSVNNSSYMRKKKEIPKTNIKFNTITGHPHISASRLIRNKG